MWIFLYEGQYLMQELQCLKSALLGIGIYVIFFMHFRFFPHRWRCLS